MPSPIGHALGGVLIGLLIPKQGFDQPHQPHPPYVTWCAVFACLPDIDFLWGRHNMETHSIGATVLVGLITYAISRRPALAFACALAWGSHIVFDWLGSDDTPPIGVMALWPFTSNFYFAEAFVFEAISRRYAEPGFWEQNIWAVVKEVLMLVPPTAALWWWRKRFKGSKVQGFRGNGMTRVLLGLAAIGLSVTSLFAQPIAQATCKRCPATYIGDEEIQQYLKRAMAMKTVDQQVRSVDVGRSNVAIGLVHRTKIEKPGEVAEHDHVSEVYHIISGSATLVTGPDLVGAERRPATNTAVRFLNGPGHNAKSITNGVSHQLKAGDVMIIPAGTGHWFTKIDDHITYLMVRVDPDKVTPLKDEAASKADLAGKK